MGHKLKFCKMSGAGNDFVVIDNRQGLVPEPASALAARLCDRHKVGADGLLLVEKSSRKNFRMRYFKGWHGTYGIAETLPGARGKRV